MEGSVPPDGPLSPIRHQSQALCFSQQLATQWSFRFNPSEPGCQLRVLVPADGPYGRAAWASLLQLRSFARSAHRTQNILLPGLLFIIKGYNSKQPDGRDTKHKVCGKGREASMPSPRAPTVPGSLSVGVFEAPLRGRD